MTGQDRRPGESWTDFERRLKDAEALGLAWQAAEEALPEGARLRITVDPTDHESRRYFVETDVGRGFGVGHYHPADSPTAALKALTEALATRLRGERE